MFRKFIALIALLALTTGFAGSAFAAFADLDLIRVYYDRSGAEIATDLGNVNDLIANGGSIDGTFSGSTGTVGSTGFAVYFALDRANNDLWATGIPSTPSLINGGATGLTGIKNGTTSMYSLYNTGLVGNTYYTTASHPNSYKSKLSGTQGYMAAAINSSSRLNTEISLAGLANGSLTQVLYKWEDGLTTDPNKKIGVAVATITTYPDGSSVITAPKNSQTIDAFTFHPQSLDAGGTTTVTATATSRLQVSFSSTTPDVCSVSGATLNGDGSTTATVTAAADAADKNCTITADQAGGFNGGTDYYPAVQKSQGITVMAQRKTQTITFTSLSARTYGDADFDPGATASSGLPVTYESSIASVATIVDGKVHIVGAGDAVITARQGGDTTYGAAPDVSQTLTVNKANQVTAVTVSAPPGAAYGETGLTALASGGDGTGAYGYSHGNSSACEVDAASGAITIKSGSGTCSITATRAGDGNFFTSLPSEPAQVLMSKTNQGAVTVTVPPSATYGEAGLTALASGGNGTGAYGYDATGSTACTVNPATGEITITSGSGNCSITAIRAGDDNYNAAQSAPGTLSVNPASLTVTAGNAGRAYGSDNNTANPGFNASGLVGSDSISSVTYDYEASATSTASAGSTHKIIPKAAQFGAGSAANYSITYATGTLTITPRALTVTADNAGRAYGSDNNTANPGFTAPALVNGDSIGSVVYAYAASATPTANAGSAHSITPGSAQFGAGSAANYTITYAAGTLTITPRPLAVTANNASRAYGTANPADPGFTAPALVNGDSIGSVTYTYAATASPTADLGSTHSITPSAAQFSAGSAANYAITYAAGTLTISGGASQSITFTPPASAAYGDAPISLGDFANASSGLPISFILESGPATLVNGQLTITGAGEIKITANQGGNAAYSAAPDEKRTITVTPKALTVTAGSATRTYGSANDTANPGFTAPALVNGDSINSVAYAYAASATSTANAGSTHVITPGNAQFGAGSAANYTITYVTGTLTITPKVLTITAINAGRTYGAANPADPGFTTSGLAGTDSISSVAYDYAAAATPTANAGSTHSITPSNAQFGAGSAANYTITYATGTLTITPKVLTITANNASRVFGAANPADPGFTAPALVNGDSIGSVTYTYAASATPTANAGSTHSITPGSAQFGAGSAANYTISYATGTLTITPKTLTVTAHNASRAYGAVNPANPGFTAPGLSGTDSISSVIYTYAASANSTAALGSTHNITPSAAQFSVGSAANYDITYADGTLTIAGAASQTITFNPLQAKKFGDADFNPGATASSGLAVTYQSSNTAVATIVSGNVRIVGAGTTEITAIQAGDSSFSAAQSVTRTLSVSAAAPGVPTNVSAAAGNAQATVTFTPPTSDGGSPIQKYTVTWTPADGTDADAESASLSHRITGLKNGTEYTFTVKAENSAGSGASSAASKATPFFMFTVTPVAGGNGSISPSASMAIKAGDTASFTVTPSANFQILGVGDNCAANNGSSGKLIGNTYTTGAIFRNCTVTASFVAIPGMKGDLTGIGGILDGRVDISDALLALQFAVGMKTTGAADLAACDIAPANGDGRCDIADALKILKIAVGL